MSKTVPVCAAPKSAAAGDRQDRRRSEPLDLIIQVLRKVHGREVGCYDETFLAKNVAKRMEVTGSPTMAEYSRWVAKNPPEAERLSEGLTISFSEFFRNPLSFAVLEEVVLPRLVAAKRAASGVIRVWSAGCAAGQEAYSVAMLLEDLATARKTGPAFRILATDLSEPALAAAREGVYEATEVGQVRLRHLRDYFEEAGPAYRIGARLRARVEVSAYDLLDEASSSPPASIYGDFDLILCSNVLLYYRPEVREGLLDKLERALGPGGYLVTGEAERNLAEQCAGWQAVAPPAAVFQKVLPPPSPGRHD